MLVIKENNLPPKDHDIAYLVSDLPTLDRAVNRLRKIFPEYFVYRGGHHVALHSYPNGERLLLIVEESEEK